MAVEFQILSTTLELKLLQSRVLASLAFLLRGLRAQSFRPELKGHIPIMTSYNIPWQLLKRRTGNREREKGMKNLQHP